jgi:hypothetical protein
LKSFKGLAMAADDQSGVIPPDLQIYHLTACLNNDGAIEPAQPEQIFGDDAGDESPI